MSFKLANPTAQPTSTPTNKTIAATTGAGVGAAIAVIVLYVVDPDGHLPEAVRGAVNVLVTAFVTFLAGYLTPPGSSEAVIVNERGKVLTGK